MHRTRLISSCHLLGDLLTELRIDSMGRMEVDVVGTEIWMERRLVARKDDIEDVYRFCGGGL